MKFVGQNFSGVVPGKLIMPTRISCEPPDNAPHNITVSVEVSFNKQQFTSNNQQITLWLELMERKKTEN